MMSFCDYSQGSKAKKCQVWKKPGVSETLEVANNRLDYSVEGASGWCKVFHFVLIEDEKQCVKMSVFHRRLFPSKAVLCQASQLKAEA